MKFSFILSVPAILGANIFNIPEALSSEISKNELWCYLAGMVCAMICGLIAMKLLLYISRKSKFGFFTYYCMIVGILVAVLG